MAEIGLRAGKGQVFPQELEVALAEGTIGAEEHAGFLAELKRHDDDNARRADGVARFKDLLANGEKPDADDPADRAAVDAMFENLAEAIAGRPPEEKANIETRFVRRTGILPAALRDTLIGGMLSDDAAAQVAAAGRIVAFENTGPALTADIPDDILARARTLKAYVYPGLPPARIVQLASEKIAQQGEQGKDRGVEPIAPPGTPQQPATGGNGT